MDFHKKYKKVSPWWRFIRQEFQLNIPHAEYTGIFGYEYQDDFVKLERSGIISMDVGFRWGASSVTIDSKSTRRASLVHDGFFHIAQSSDIFEDDSGKNSEDIMLKTNELLYKTCIEDGMYKWRAKMWREALDYGGHKAWNS